MTIISDLEQFQQKLVGEGLTEQAVELQNIIESAKSESQEPTWWHHEENGEHIFMNMQFGLPDETPLFTHPPLSYETVKDSERWNAIIHSGAYSPSDFCNPIGLAGRTNQYSKEQLNKSVDDYIEKHMKALNAETKGA